MTDADQRRTLPWQSAADLAIGLALGLVPLAFHTGVGEFGSFKLLVLAACVGVGLVALSRTRGVVPRRALVLGLPLVQVLAVLAWRPGFDAMNQAMALVAPLLLAWMAAVRVPSWSRRRLIVVLVVPLGIDLAWSLLQGAGVGVLPATQIAFGTTHGVAVGTVGNPNENCWYLILATTLLLGVWPRRLRAVAVGLVACVLLVVFVDRSRAALLAILVGLAAWGILGSSPRRRLGAGILLGALVVLALGAAWGGLDALAGRVYLARIQLGMLMGEGGYAAGLGAFAVDFPAAQAAHLIGHPDQVGFSSRLDHAHNDLFELSYELGVSSLVWIVAIGVAVWRTPGRATRLQRMAIVCLAEGVVLSMFGYPLFSPASAVVLALALALCLGNGSARGWRQGGGTRIVLSVLGVLLIVAGARRYASETAQTQTLQSVYEGDLEGACVHAHEAVQAWPDSAALEMVHACRHSTAH